MNIAKRKDHGELLIFVAGNNPGMIKKPYFYKALKPSSRHTMWVKVLGNNESQMCPRPF